MNPMSDDTALRIRVPAVWKYLDGVRRFCGFYARVTWGDDDLAQRVEVIVHELCETACRSGERAPGLEIGVDGTEAVFEVSVSNDAEPGISSAVKRAAEELHPLDPEEAFRTAMLDSSDPEVAEAKLGIARLRYEARVVVAVEASDGRVTLTARGRR